MVQHAARVARSAIRAGAFTGTTARLARGFVQGNIAIVPSDVADQFARYCAENSRACPVLSVGRAGDPSLPSMGQGIDIRTDLPRYYIYRQGVFAEERGEIASLWRRDFVTFVIGCSFTFEHALRDAGVPLRHVESNRNVAMYRTNRSTYSVGPFGGALVVSMRPFSSEARIAQSRSAPVFQRCTARQFIAAIPPYLALPTFRGRITVRLFPFEEMTCLCSGPAE
jgi:uncharacterized protein YcsI (UPF0317 family)